MRSPAFEQWVDDNADCLHGSTYRAEEFWDGESGEYSHWKYSSINVAWRTWCAALGFVAAR